MRWRHLVYAGMLIGAAACTLDATRSCDAVNRCAGSGWTGLASIGVGLGILCAVGIVVARSVWHCHAALRCLGSFVPVRSAHLTGFEVRVARATIVDADTPFALCAGVLRPRVFISSALAERLGAGELRAVVLHEASHARRRDPLRRALRSAAAQTLFFAPGVRWWSDRAGVIDELIADQAALRGCDVNDLAGALLLTGSPRAALAASFDGAAASRIAHLLGDPVALPRPPAGVWRRSVAGIIPLIVVIGCLTASLVVAR
jgi:hypothetical protein